MAQRLPSPERPRIVSRTPSLDERLRFAIANKRLIQLTYGGSLRIAEPHDYGIQHGTTKLLIYQRSAPGASPRAATRGWRMLTVSKISSCVILEKTFSGSRSESDQHHFAWDVVHARVSGAAGP